jgi:hypothetical protein
MAEALCDQLFSDVDGDLMRQHTSDTDDLLGILEAWEDCVTGGGATTPRGAEVLHQTAGDAAATPKPAAAKRRRQGCREEDGTAVPAPKRQRCSPVSSEAAAASEDGAANKTSHITVERNRRKQMNEHLAVLRSLMPCFYVKRVINYSYNLYYCIIDKPRDRFIICSMIIMIGNLPVLFCTL